MQKGRCFLPSAWRKEVRTLRNAPKCKKTFAGTTIGLSPSRCFSARHDRRSSIRMSILQPTTVHRAPTFRQLDVVRGGPWRAEIAILATDLKASSWRTEEQNTHYDGSHGEIHALCARHGVSHALDNPSATVTRTTNALHRIASGRCKVCPRARAMPSSIQCATSYQRAYRCCD